ncbi:MAG: sulfotransferase domain-containing protein [Anaerolineales bacterium]|nr:sulfotransferase domain-containing protein [Anaerolineales bacterium]
MIILSVGMPRAGSGWYYNLTHDLATSSGGQDARQIRQQFHLQGILTEVNCNIGVLSPRRLLAVLAPSLLGNTFVIKAHAAPTPLALALLRRGWMRAAYIYRDPRDALLSAWENGQRAVERGAPNAFSHLTDFEASLNFMRQYVDISKAWLAKSTALHTRYEDLLKDYDSEVNRLVAYLQFDRQSQTVQGVVEKYRPEQARSEQKGMHFSKGKVGRFRQKLTPMQQQQLAEAFGDYLQAQGYDL